MDEIIPSERIQARILTLRGQRVLLDADLAALYGVSTKRLNEQVRRNRRRFPGDFMFQLKQEEVAAMWSQIATTRTGRGGRRTRPYAFTEHGAIQAANVLQSEAAILMGVEVVRAFVRLRRLLLDQRTLAALRELTAPPEPPPARRIGFHPQDA